MCDLSKSHAPKVVDDQVKPIIVVGFVQISSLLLYLQNGLASSHIVKNLISVDQFTHDNYVSIKYDPFSFP
jgi:hypothetical protein